MQSKSTVNPLKYGSIEKKKVHLKPSKIFFVRDLFQISGD